MSDDEPEDGDCEIRLQILTDENDHLRQELNRLKAQFSAVADIRQELERLHSENNSLTSKLRDASLTSEDLNRRLQLSITSSEEKVSEVTKSYEEKINFAEQEISELRRQLKANEEKYTEEKTALASEVTQYTKKLETANLEKEAINRKIDKLLRAAENLYKQNFRSIESVVAKIESLQFTVEETHAQKAKDKKDETIEQLQYQLCVLQKKCSKKNQEKRAAMSRLSKAEQVIDKLAQENKQLEKNAAKAVAKLKEEMESREQDHKRRITELEKQNDATKSMLGTQKCQTVVIPPIIERTPAPVVVDSDDSKYQKKLKEKDAELKRLKEKVKEQKLLVEKETKQRSEKESALERMKEQVHNLELQNSNLQTELNSTKERCKMAESDAKAAHDQFMAMATKPKEDHGAKKIALESKLRNSESTNRELRNKVRQLEDEKESLKKNIERFNDENAKKQAEIESLNHKVNELTTQITFEAARSQPLQPKVAPSPVQLPPSCFMCTGAPSELVETLKTITSNGNMQSATKVQLAMSSTVAFYNKTVAKLNAAIQELKDTMDTHKTGTDTIIREVGEIVNSHVSPSTIATSEAERNSFLAALSAYRENLGRIECENQYLHKLYDGICALLRVKGADEIEPTVRAMMKDNQNMAKQAKELLTALKRAKREKKGISRHFAETNSHLSSKLQESTEENNTLTEELSDMKKQTQKYEDTISELRSQIEMLNSQIEMRQEEFKTSHESHQQQVEQQINDLMGEWQTAINSRQDTIEKLNTDIESISNEKSALKKAVQSLKTKLAQASEALEEAKENCEQEKQRMKLSFDEQIKNNNAANKHIVTELQTQMGDLRTLLTKQSQSLAAIEAKNKELSKELNEMKRQNTRYRSQLTTEREAATREQKILETKIRSCELNVETKLSSSIAEVRAQAETEKQNMIALFAEEFRSFFDPREQIDIHTYQAILRRAHDELARLTDEIETIRRITNASPSQSTPDAVSQLVFHGQLV